MKTDIYTTGLDKMFRFSVTVFNDFLKSKTLLNGCYMVKLTEMGAPHNLAVVTGFTFDDIYFTKSFPVEDDTVDLSEYFSEAEDANSSEESYDEDESGYNTDDFEEDMWYHTAEGMAEEDEANEAYALNYYDAIDAYLATNPPAAPLDNMIPPLKPRKTGRLQSVEDPSTFFIFSHSKLKEIIFQ